MFVARILVETTSSNSHSHNSIELTFLIFPRCRRLKAQFHLEDVAHLQGLRGRSSPWPYEGRDEGNFFFKNTHENCVSFMLR
jgi:hypothetical protein